MENHSPHFSFNYADSDSKTCTVSFYAETWAEALDQFVQFLRGCGFTLDNDSVGINTKKHILYQDCICNITEFETDD